LKIHCIFAIYLLFNLNNSKMENFDPKKHWENIYQTKALTEVSWFQSTPETSLEYIKKFSLPLNAKIIDVGGGDSFLVDNLLDLGFQDITVLDISEKALERAQKRLGERAAKVKWIGTTAPLFTF
jgi:2-polyprenyl-3-methyl-5-hydroxy-6-metoxy-1,4-benzoquinol methylase